jgi:addiction module RelE/StbE family toxin
MFLAWKPKAMTDREAIMDYIARDNPLAAVALDDAFEACAESARLQPALYRKGRVHGTREIVVHPNYVIVYCVIGNELTILRVLHSAQQWPVAD